MANELEFILRMQDQASGVLRGHGQVAQQTGSSVQGFADAVKNAAQALGIYTGSADKSTQAVREHAEAARDSADAVEHEAASHKKAGDHAHEHEGALKKLASTAKEAAESVAAIWAANEISEKTVGDFLETERGLKQLEQTTRLASAAFDDLKDSIETVTHVSLSTSTEDVIELMKAASRLGIEGSENLTKFATLAGMIGNVTGQNANAVASSIAVILQNTGELAKGQEHALEVTKQLGNVFDELGKHVVGGAAGLQQMTAALSGTLTSLGLTTREIVGVAAAGQRLGVSSEAFAKAFVQSIGSIRSAAERGGVEAENMANQMGLSIEQFKELSRTNPVETFQRFLNVLHSIGEAGVPITDTLRNVGIAGRGVSTTLATAARNVDQFNKAMKDVDAAAMSNALERDNKETLDLLSAMIERIKKTAIDAFGDIGTAFAPVLKPMLEAAIVTIDALKAGFMSLPAPVRTAVASFIILTPAILAAQKAGHFMKETFEGLNSLRTGGGMFGTLVRGAREAGIAAEELKIKQGEVAASAEAEAAALNTSAIAAQRTGAAHVAGAAEVNVMSTALKNAAVSAEMAGGAQAAAAVEGAVAQTAVASRTATQTALAMRTSLLSAGAASVTTAGLFARSAGLIRTAFAALGGPVGLAITAIILGLSQLYEHWDQVMAEIHKSPKQIAGDLVDVFKGVTDSINNAADATHRFFAEMQKPPSGNPIEAQKKKAEEFTKLADEWGFGFAARSGQALARNAQQSTGFTDAVERDLRSFGNWMNDFWEHPLWEATAEESTKRETEKITKGIEDQVKAAQGAATRVAAGYQRPSGMVGLRQEAFNRDSAAQGRAAAVVNAATPALADLDDRIARNDKLIEQQTKLNALRALPGFARGKGETDEEIAAQQRVLDLRRQQLDPMYALNNSLQDQLASAKALTKEEENRVAAAKAMSDAQQSDARRTQADIASVGEQTRAIQAAQIAKSYADQVRQLQQGIATASAITREDQARVEIEQKLSDLARTQGITDEGRLGTLRRMLDTERLLKEAKEIEDRLNPEAAAQRAYQDDLKSLDVMRQKGVIQTDTELARQKAVLAQSTLASRDPYAAQVQSLERQNNLLKIKGEYQEADTKAAQQAQDIYDKTGTLLQGQVDKLVEMNRQAADLQKAQNSGFQGFINQNINIQDQLKSLETSFASGLSDAIVGALQGKKGSFTQFFTNLSDQMMKAAVNNLLAQTFAGLGLGTTSGSSSTSSSNIFSSIMGQKTPTAATAQQPNFGAISAASMSVNATVVNINGTAAPAPVSSTTAGAPKSAFDMTPTGSIPTSTQGVTPTGGFAPSSTGFTPTGTGFTQTQGFMPQSAAFSAAPPIAPTPGQLSSTTFGTGSFNPFGAPSLGTPSSAAGFGVSGAGIPALGFNPSASFAPTLGPGTTTAATAAAQQSALVQQQATASAAQSALASNAAVQSTAQQQAAMASMGGLGGMSSFLPFLLLGGGMGLSYLSNAFGQNNTTVTSTKSGGGYSLGGNYVQPYSSSRSYSYAPAGTDPNSIFAPSQNVPTGGGRVVADPNSNYVKYGGGSQNTTYDSSGKAVATSGASSSSDAQLKSTISAALPFAMLGGMAFAPQIAKYSGLDALLGGTDKTPSSFGSAFNKFFGSGSSGTPSTSAAPTASAGASSSSSSGFLGLGSLFGGSTSTSGAAAAPPPMTPQQQEIIAYGMRGVPPGATIPYNPSPEQTAAATAYTSLGTTPGIGPQLNTTPGLMGSNVQGPFGEANTSGAAYQLQGSAFAAQAGASSGMSSLLAGLPLIGGLFSGGGLFGGSKSTTTSSGSSGGLFGGLFGGGGGTAGGGTAAGTAGGTGAGFAGFLTGGKEGMVNGYLGFGGQPGQQGTGPMSGFTLNNQGQFETKIPSLVPERSAEYNATPQMDFSQSPIPKGGFFPNGIAPGTTPAGTPPSAIAYAPPTVAGGQQLPAPTQAPTTPGASLAQPYGPYAAGDARNILLPEAPTNQATGGARLSATDGRLFADQGAPGGATSSAYAPPTLGGGFVQSGILPTFASQGVAIPQTPVAPGAQVAGIAGQMPSGYSANQLSASLIAGRESFSAKPYYDVNGLAIGYGDHRLDGRAVQAGDRVTQPQAQANLESRLQDYQGVARNQIGEQAWNNLTPQQQAALTSNAYNYGSLQPGVVRAAQSGDAGQLGDALRAQRGQNQGVNASRRDQEADIVEGKQVIDPKTNTVMSADKYAQTYGQQQTAVAQAGQTPQVQAQAQQSVQSTATPRATQVDQFGNTVQPIPPTPNTRGTAEMGQLDRTPTGSVPGSPGGTVDTRMAAAQQGLQQQQQAQAMKAEQQQQMELQQKQLEQTQEMTKAQNSYSDAQLRSTDSVQGAVPPMQSFDAGLSSVQQPLSQMPQALGGFQSGLSSLLQGLGSGGGGGGGLGGLGGIFGGGGGFGGLGGLGFHSGGLVGAPGAHSFVRNVPASTFIGAPRFHSGLMNDEYPAILQRGERVLTASSSQRTQDTISGLADQVSGLSQVLAGSAGGRGGTGTINKAFNSNVTIVTPDANSFRRSNAQTSAMMASNMQRLATRNN